MARPRTSLFQNRQMRLRVAEEMPCVMHRKLLLRQKKMAYPDRQSRLDTPLQSTDTLRAQSLRQSINQRASNSNIVRLREYWSAGDATSRTIVPHASCAQIQNTATFSIWGIVITRSNPHLPMNRFALPWDQSISPP